MRENPYLDKSFHVESREPKDNCKASDLIERKNKICLNYLYTRRPLYSDLASKDGGRFGLGRVEKTSGGRKINHVTTVLTIFVEISCVELENKENRRRKKSQLQL